MEYMLIILIVLSSLLISYITIESTADMIMNRKHNQEARLIIKKIIFCILAIYIVFLSTKSLYSIYQYNKIYNEFKKTEVTNNIDISKLKDAYILLEGKIKSESVMFQNEYIEDTSKFVYLEESNEHYSGKCGWENDSESKFYANNVSDCNVPIDLKAFDINNSEGIKEEDIKEPYKKYYDQNLYFNKSNGSKDKRIVYKVLRNNDDILIFSRVKYGKVVSLSNINNSIIFAGGDNYKRLESYLKDSSKQDISFLGFVCVATLISVLIIFKKNQKISKIILKLVYKWKTLFIRKPS